MTTTTHSESPEDLPHLPARVNPQRWLDHNFTRLLVAIAVAGLIPRLFVGNAKPIGQDGWWHLFTATQDNWLIMLSEWKRIAHPPLFYPLLRMAALFGHSHLMLRSVGILCGCATTVVLGAIAARIYRYKTSALLAAAAYAFAWNIIEMNCDLRAYPIALLFVMLAFSAWLDWYADPSHVQSGRAIVRFGVWLSLAELCEYYALFFLSGCLGILILRDVLRPGFRGVLLHSLRVNWKPWIFATGLPAALFFVLFRYQQNYSLVELPYIQPFIWNPELNPGFDWFLLSNIGREIGYFTPFNLDPDVMLPVISLLFIPALVYLSSWRKGLLRGDSSTVPVWLALIILAQMLVLSVVKMYPFGGEFRHQSIVAPFVFLSSFLLLDLLAGALKASAARYAIFSMAGVLIAASFAYGWTVYPWNAMEYNTAELARFKQLFPNPGTIYIDKVSTNFFYGENNNSKWNFQGEFPVNGQRIVAYRLDDGKGQTVRLLRNKRDPWIEPLDVETYRVLAEALQHEKLNSAVLFYMSLKWDAGGAKDLEEAIRTLAPQAGLECARYEVGRTYVFAEFKLRGVPSR